ncbi:MAG: SPW repeat protein [Gammaproteobacteria bacterium]|nr:SPW repeat protein [Gammaproteobacteria bacterium]
MLAPFFGIGAIGDVAAINSYLIGTVVALVAFMAIAKPEVWKEYTNLTLGLWLIAAPFVLSFTNLAGPMWNQIIVGLLIGAAAYDVTLKKPTSTVGHGGPKGHGHGHA